MDVFILALLQVQGRHIGLRIAVLAGGQAKGQYSHLKTNVTDRKHPFHDIFINQLFVFNF